MSDHKVMLRLNEGEPFPLGVMLVPTGDVPIRDYARSAYVRHNAAVQAWHKRSVGAVSDVRPNEAAVLDFLAGLVGLLGHDNFDRDNPDGYTCEHIGQPLLDVVGNVLNLDMGRLDGAAVSEYAWNLLRPFTLEDEG